MRPSLPPETGPPGLDADDSKATIGLGAVAELADAGDLKSSVRKGRAGSTPARPTSTLLNPALGPFPICLISPN